MNKSTIKTRDCYNQPLGSFSKFSLATPASDEKWRCLIKMHFKCLYKHFLDQQSERTICHVAGNEYRVKPNTCLTVKTEDSSVLLYSTFPPLAWVSLISAYGPLFKTPENIRAKTQDMQ